MAFRENSDKLNKTLSKEIRKKQGIYFTPKKARNLLFETLKDVKPKNILEPSFGSGEFLDDVIEHYPKGKVVGVEYNETIFKSYTTKSKNLTLVNTDFLKYNSDIKFDLILGNPPYFVIKEKNANFMVGRANIYVAFLYKCLTEHLTDNGYLAFVLPTSLYNCSYYEPMRKYIAENCSILFVQTLDVEYYETQQDTMLLVLQKKKDETHNYLFLRNNMYYISPYAKELSELVKDTKTISELGLKVKTGDVVWNQNKEILADSGTLLIYNTNIVDGKLVLNNIKSKEKKQYIKGFHKTPISGKAILVNRGYGNIDYKFNYVMVDMKEFYAENHVNMILPKTKKSEKNLDLVKKSFEDKRTEEFLKKFIGNGAMSKTEIEKVMPVFA